jgi:hypothetical protein
MECDLELGGEGEPIDGYKRELIEGSVENCAECQTEIPAGAIREVVTGRFEGEPNRMAHVLELCPHCRSVLHRRASPRNVMDGTGRLRRSRWRTGIRPFQLSVSRSRGNRSG